MRNFIQVAIFIFSFCLAFLLFQWKVEKLRISLKFIISICLAWIVTFAASFFAVDRARGCERNCIRGTFMLHTVYES